MSSISTSQTPNLYTTNSTASDNVKQGKNGKLGKIACLILTLSNIPYTLSSRHFIGRFFNKFLSPLLCRLYENYIILLNYTNNIVLHSRVHPLIC
jgi:hypothetical protein